jgi:hypothetical protein
MSSNVWRWRLLIFRRPRGHTETERIATYLLGNSEHRNKCLQIKGTLSWNMGQ